jgi:lipase maturation factor 1
MWFPPHYTLIASLFPRLLGLIFLFAFVPFLFQIKGLLGTEGILPIQNLLNGLRHYPLKKRLFYLPTFFWMRADNRMLIGLVLTGIFISICLMAGLHVPFCLFFLYFLYLSIVSTGQEFLGFGWEGFLLEVTFYTFWLSLTSVPNLMIWTSLNFLLFRFHIQAGAVKLQSYDLTWKNLTALAFHYQTQPLPNTQAWFFYRLPLKFHQLSSLLMFVIELVFPFALLLDDWSRAVAGVAFIGLQGMIWFTGNFAYLNYLTACLSLITLSNYFLSPWIAEPILNPASIELDYLLTLLGSLFVIMQGVRLWHHFVPNAFFQWWLSYFTPFHLFNPYGIFAVMTTKRYEIIIEGSENQLEWKEYLFCYKPSEIQRRPRRISPYQPRLDWQMWFLPFNTFEQQKWFHSFIYHLLKGTPAVLKLIRHNPFPHSPPLYLRALIYDYRFSTPKERKLENVWWKRNYRGPFSPTLSLKKIKN